MKGRDDATFVRTKADFIDLLLSHCRSAFEDYWETDVGAIDCRIKNNGVRFDAEHRTTSQRTSYSYPVVTSIMIALDVHC